MGAPGNVPIVFCREEDRTLNKQELVSAVADETSLPRADAAAAVEAVFESITDALKRGDDVRLIGFGTFNVTRRAASEGRNPQTGEKIKIKASNLPRFKAGKTLKDAVN